MIVIGTLSGRRCLQHCNTYMPRISFSDQILFHGDRCCHGYSKRKNKSGVSEVNGEGCNV